MLNINNSIGIKKTRRADGHLRRIYKFVCSTDGCNEIIYCRIDGLKTHSGKCLTHSHVKRPFESIYNRLCKDWRKPTIELTYRQFLNFTKTKYCHYCGDKIPWEPFATVKGEYRSAAYFLDRKDNAGPYSKNNCAVCCTSCNILKSDNFSYKEFLIIGDSLCKIRLQRAKLAKAGSAAHEI